MFTPLDVLLPLALVDQSQKEMAASYGMKKAARCERLVKSTVLCEC